jgi:hypothetical protein
MEGTYTLHDPLELDANGWEEHTHFEPSDENGWEERAHLEPLDEDGGEEHTGEDEAGIHSRIGKGAQVGLLDHNSLFVLIPASSG